MLSTDSIDKLKSLVLEAENNGESFEFIQNQLIPAFKAKYDQAEPQKMVPSKAPVSYDLMQPPPEMEMVVAPEIKDEWRAVGQKYGLTDDEVFGYQKAFEAKGLTVQDFDNEFAKKAPPKPEPPALPNAEFRTQPAVASSTEVAVVPPEHPRDVSIGVAKEETGKPETKKPLFDISTPQALALGAATAPGIKQIVGAVSPRKLNYVTQQAEEQKPIATAVGGLIGSTPAVIGSASIGAALIPANIAKLIPVTSRVLSAMAGGATYKTGESLIEGKAPKAGEVAKEAMLWGGLELGLAKILGPIAKPIVEKIRLGGEGLTTKEIQLLESSSEQLLKQGEKSGRGADRILTSGVIEEPITIEGAMVGEHMTVDDMTPEAVDKMLSAIADKPTEFTPLVPKTPSFEEIEKLPRDVRKRIHEQNPVTERPGTPAFVRRIKELTDNGNKDAYVMFWDINGTKVNNDKLLGEGKTNRLIQKVYDEAAPSVGNEYLFNPHGDEFFSISDNLDDLISKSRKAAQNIANNIRIIDPETKKVYQVTISGRIGKVKILEDVGRINPKEGTGKNEISIDKSVGKEYNNIQAASGVLPERIITRKLLEAPSEKPITNTGIGKGMAGRSEAGTASGGGTGVGIPGIKEEIPRGGNVPLSVEVPKATDEYLNALFTRSAEELDAKAAGTVRLDKIVEASLKRSEADPKAWDLKTIANTLASQAEPAIKQAKRSPVTWEQSRAFNERFGISQEEFKSRKIGEAYNQEQMIQAQNYVTANYDAVDESLKALSKAYGPKNLADMSPELKAKAKLVMQEAYLAMAQYQGAGAEAARALSARRRIAPLMRNKEWTAALEQTGGKQLTDAQLASLLDLAKNGTMSPSALKNTMEANTIDKVHEAWINAILSAPLTHIVNITSNALTALMKPLLERPATATIEMVKGLAPGYSRQAYFREIPHDVWGMMKGFTEGVRGVLKGFDETAPQFAGRKTETAHTRAIKGKLGSAINVPTTFLSKADDFFKTIVYRGQIEADAYRLARQSGLKGDEFAKKLSELRVNPTKTMLDKASKEAQYRTFTQPLGKLGNRIMELRNTIWPLKFIIPFVKTPTNIAKFAIERTPAELADIFKKVKSGKLKGVELSEELAKPMIGTAMMAAVYIMAKEGYVTGWGPKDTKERYAKYKTGWLPYAFKIGDKYYSFARLEPFGSIFGVAADMSEMSESLDGKTWDEKFYKGMGLGVKSVVRNIGSKTFLQGMSKAFDALSDPQRYGEDWLQATAGSLVPNIIASGARASDDYYRQIDNMADLFKSRIPGLSEEVPAKRDVFGEKQKRSGTALTRMFSPVAVSEKAGDKIDAELVRLKMGFAPPNKKISLNREDVKQYGLNKDIELTPVEFESFQKRVGTLAKSKTREVMYTPEYQEADDEGKKQMIEAVVSAARGEVIEEYQPRLLTRAIKERPKTKKE